MISNFLRYIKGYVSIELSGSFTERFLNICMARGIGVWAIKKPDANKMTLCISAADFKKIRTVARKSRTKVKILEKNGFIFELRTHKKRRFFLVGLIFFICFIFAASQFVFHVEIHGAKNLSEQHITQLLKEEGVFPGALKSRLDQNKIKNNILLKEETLSWIWVDLKGSKAIVSVSERKMPPAISSDRSPRDMVAAKDGVIFSYNATAGTPKIKEGDSVLAGQLLISGVVTSEIIPHRYTKADGEVWARTWYRKEGVFSPEIYPLIQTDEKKIYRTVSLFGFDINLFFKDKSPYDTYTQESDTVNLELFGRHTGITLKKKTYTKTEPQKKLLTEKELEEYAKEELLKQITAELCEENSLTGCEISHVKNPDGTYIFTLECEFKEQIASPEPITNPLLSENTE